MIKLAKRILLTTGLIIAGLLLPTAVLAQGSLNNGDEHDGDLLAAEEVDIWRVSAHAGDWILIRLARLGGTTLFTPTMNLYGPGGQYLRRGGWNALNGEIAYQAAVSGEYSIHVQDGSGPGGHTGAYRLRLARIPDGFVVPGGDEGGELANGANQPGTLAPADLDMWTFEAQQGDTLLLRLQSHGGENNFAPSVRLFGPDGAYVGEAPWNSLQSEIDRTAKQTGTYTAVVTDDSSYGIGSGDYTLRLQRIPGSFVVPTGDHGGALVNGTNQPGTIKPADLDGWTFAAQAGDRMLLRVQGHPGGTDNFIPIVRLFGPDGTYVGKASWNSLQSEIDLKAEQTGTYTAVVTDGSTYGIGSGDYTLRLVKIPGGFVIPGGDEGGVIESDAATPGAVEPADLDRWIFEAEAGDSLTLRLDRNSELAGFWPSVRLFDPQGNYLGLAAWSSSGGGIATTAPVTGTYSVVVSDSNNYGIGHGAYTLHFSLTKPPLIFIPGIAGSVLELGGLDLWPTIDPLKVLALDLENGLPGVRATDVLRQYDAGVAGIVMEFYGPMIEHLKTQRRYVEYPLSRDPDRLTSDHMLVTHFARKPSLFLFPYDWRRSNAEQSAILHQYVSNIRQLHGGAPVRFVVHSMGGLVARRYILEYGAAGIDRVITIGSPYWGAPVATYRVMRGDFHEPYLFLLNWINNDSIKRSLATFPGFHELLPSPAYSDHGGFPVFSEFGRDLNNNGVNRESYTIPQYHALMDYVVRGRGVDQYPSQNSLNFHGYLNGRQDDSSADGNSIKYLQIVGEKLRNDTTVEVIATAETHFSLNEMHHVLRYIERKGPGDGTVPTLSARRLPAFHPPEATTITLTGGDEVGHNELTKNPIVWELLTRFLRGETLSSGILSTSASKTKLSEEGVETTRVVTLLGAGYVKVRNAAGDENTRLSEIAALSVPGVAIRYGGDEPWVDLEADVDMELFVQGVPDGGDLEIEVTGYDDLRNVTSVRRYRFSPGLHVWRLHLPSGGASDLMVDADDSTTFDPGETVVPTHLAASGPVDVTSPTIAMTLTLAGGEVSVAFAGADDSGAAPTLRYQEAAGLVQAYSSPLMLSATAPTSLKAFAEDGMGNTSGLIETTINPPLATELGTNSTIRVLWPVADGYVLEQSPALGGAWEPAPVGVIRSNLLESATLPLGNHPNLIFRLRSQPVTR